MKVLYRTYIHIISVAAHDESNSIYIGHPGWRIAQIQNISSKWLQLEPDIITIHLGTNDCGQDPSNSTAAVESLESLLQLIAEKLPTTQVFVSSLVAMRSQLNHGKGAACVVEYNTQVNSTREKYGKNFHYVPLSENTTQPLVCGDNQNQYCIGHGVHPNPFGHMRVGSVFANVIANTLCPNHENDHSC